MPWTKSEIGAAFIVFTVMVAVSGAVVLGAATKIGLVRW
jgi:hypothetical protein